jgi:hypothetical protein
VSACSLPSEGVHESQPQGVAALGSWLHRGASAVKDSRGIAKRRAVTLTAASTAPDLVGWGQLRSNVGSPARVAVLPIVRRTTTNRRRGDILTSSSTKLICSPCATRALRRVRGQEGQRAMGARGRWLHPTALARSYDIAETAQRLVGGVTAAERAPIETLPSRYPRHDSESTTRTRGTTPSPTPSASRTARIRTPSTCVSSSSRPS